jgi:hypothetical protein
MADLCIFASPIPALLQSTVTLLSVTFLRTAKAMHVPTSVWYLVLSLVFFSYHAELHVHGHTVGIVSAFPAFDRISRNPVR